ncbi:hypothetical protein UFOVP1636_275 [uncultured Caudovirales phage]|uniref:Uncharacterized protein n=1 Tax=uncultured Caudovirales phage TaxID=2100421 RepID=A0A6J5T485_9CAUD|nr:hypothetical protein UFOVP1636_275 [uncultured Caudovirales phage]
MNERIRELNLQAMSIVMNGSDPDGDVDKMYIPLEFTKKFAELIVRECASKVDWIYAEKGITIDGVNFTVTQGDLIKQHFGVEE